MDLDCNSNGIPFPTLANASKILQCYRNFKGNLWFDEFRGEVYHTLRGPLPQPWTDRDTRQVTVAIQQQLRLHKFSLTLIRDAITHAAECHSRNSLTEWLSSLKWDGTERLSHWLADCAGVESTDYTQSVARNWLIGMVARAYRPGCKMDNIPVLEGVSGLNKSQLLETLGGEWYEALPMEFGTKDFLQSLQGVWLAEIPDMTGFDKADHSRVISLLSVPRDKFRKAYGYNAERFQRTTVFAATSEDDDYLLDRRGKRRFWPLRCTEIDLNALRSMRDQLFAEAVSAYQQGETWYLMPASAEQEQNARLQVDTWQDLLTVYVDPIWEQQLRRGGEPEGIPMSHILTDALKIPPHQQGIRESRRVAALLRSMGWRIKHTKLGNVWRKSAR
jgi:putative DNA primase/helicase